MARVSRDRLRSVIADEGKRKRVIAHDVPQGIVDDITERAVAQVVQPAIEAVAKLMFVCEGFGSHALALREDEVVKQWHLLFQLQL